MEYALKPGGKIFIRHNKGGIDDLIIPLLSKFSSNFTKIPREDYYITELILN